MTVAVEPEPELESVPAAVEKGPPAAAAVAADEVEVVCVESKG